MIFGDISGDGAIDLFDVMRMYQYISNVRTFDPVTLYAADVNHNDVVDLFDVMRMYQHISGARPIEEPNQFNLEEGLLHP